MYFANDGSDLNQVVDFITNKIQEELKSIGTVKLEYPQWNDSFINRKDDVLEKIKDAITNQQKIKKLTIDTQTIANPYNNDYNYMNYYGLTTRASNTSESLKILENLFVSPDALFKYNKNYMISKNFYNFNIELNPDIYDSFMKNDVTIQKIYEYVTQQTKDFLTKNSFIKPTDKVQWTANNIDWLNTSIKNTLVNGSSSQNFRLIINGNAFGMSLYANGYTNFTISRSDTDVWSTT